MCNIDWERVFAEWRTQRQLDYNVLTELLSRALDLAQDDTMRLVLRQISDTIGSMANSDQARFLANGMTHTTSTMGEGANPP